MTTVDPDKPEGIEELESLLQAATYNAKFAFASSLPSRQVGWRTKPQMLPHTASPPLYEKDEQNGWIPVDHISSALYQREQAWKSQIERQSLA